MADSCALCFRIAVSGIITAVLGPKANKSLPNVMLLKLCFLFPWKVASVASLPC